jgi:3-deoxy-D-manno-octulosonic acid (KDO) 8-phosphate synthase
MAYSAASAPAPEDALPASKDYYEQLALVAAMLGVCIDLYAVGPAFVGVEFLGPLCQKTGGSCNFYPILEEAALPQVCQCLFAERCEEGSVRNP